MLGGVGARLQQQRCLPAEVLPRVQNRGAVRRAGGGHHRGHFAEKPTHHRETEEEAREAAQTTTATTAAGAESVGRGVGGVGQRVRAG